MGSAYSRAVVAYKAVARAQPRDPAVQFELAQTAEAANDLPTAIAAYKAFLRLAPEDQSAAAVKQRVAELEARVGALVVGVDSARPEARRRAREG